MKSHNQDELWYKNAILYALDVDRFADSNGDGIGDFRGAINHLDYLRELGVTCIWLLPFFPSPNRDNGYDIMNYYTVDSDLGTLEDFIEFVHKAGERGMRVIVDLVMNHTSRRHPWFEAARRDPESRFRRYYRWSDAPPPVPPQKGSIFPGEEDTVWTYDEVAGAYYYHRFYHFQPELNPFNPEVHQEILRVLDFWLSFGVSGFRVDAAPHMISLEAISSKEEPRPHALLKEMRSYVQSRRRDAILLAESDVEPEKLQVFFGEGDEFHLLFNFALNNFLFLALARGEAEPILDILTRLPAIQEMGQWANFLRNLDEVDLERLTDAQREEVFHLFAPEESMRIFGRGIRRRLAPMLQGDDRWVKLAFSLLFSLPGTPVIVYGDEIGMGDDLTQHGRNAVRTPMQWNTTPNGGFSTAPPEKLVQPVISTGRYSYKKSNAATQRDDPESFWHWIRQLILIRRQCPEIGFGTWYGIHLSNKAVLAHRCTWKTHVFIALHNMSDKTQKVQLDVSEFQAEGLLDLFAPDRPPLHAEGGLHTIQLQEFDYRWFRVKR